MKIDQTAIQYNSDNIYWWCNKGDVHFPIPKESISVLKEWNNTHRMFFYGGVVFSRTSGSYTIIALIESKLNGVEPNKFWFGGLRTNGTDISGGFGEGSGTGGALYSSTYDKYIYRHSDEWNAIPDNLNKNHKIPTDIETRLDDLKRQRTKLESQL